MAFRCRFCGRIVTHGNPRANACKLDNTCDKKPLPRCMNCNGLFKKEKRQTQCPSSRSPGGNHVYAFKGETKEIPNDELQKVV